jgi:hypothetical protein
LKKQTIITQGYSQVGFKALVFDTKIIGSSPITLIYFYFFNFDAK